MRLSTRYVTGAGPQRGGADLVRVRVWVRVRARARARVSDPNPN